MVVILARLVYGTEPPWVKSKVEKITTITSRLKVFTPRGTIAQPAMRSVAFVVVTMNSYGVAEFLVPAERQDIFLRKSGSGDSDMNDNNHMNTCVQCLRCIVWSITGNER